MRLPSRYKCWFLTLLLLTSQAAADELLLAQAWQDVQQLSSDKMAGRFPGSAGHQLAQQYISARFSELKLQPLLADYRQPFQYKTGFFSQSSGVNLVAQIKGCRFPDAYVVVTAHYDHLKMAGSNIFNGADDNASGVAGMLYLAGKLRQSCPAYSYIFIATDAEEQGLDGAKAWLDQAPLPSTQQLLNINLDMISRGEKRQRLYLAGKRSLPALGNIPIRQHGEVKLVLGHDGSSRVGAARSSGDSSAQVDWSNASDHAVFRRAGIPYLYFGVDVHRHYHTPDDDWQQINTEFFQSALQLIHSSVQWVEQQPPAVFIDARRAR
ncbi:M28 family peptidase [Rheinheimera riviphila]|uniref:M28 family peptidase n=1 Tax=Rheinheimera riviphila TaxID=1834037 RepID=A0A437QBX8_9GAMM|nr:M28 family peptidase [Rheinheimera riviphila]RVU32026.1 M28 family peptidase [Rheinheimera riviphila]